ncbi:MAG: TauD/TfdA dioxygenase family protein, partial [Ilumatobacteraceae bacterium]
ATTVATDDAGWRAEPITGTFGLELAGARLGDGVDPGWVSSLLDEHLLLVFRDQFLTHAEQVTFGRSFGELTPAHPVVPGHPDHPEILELDGAAGGRNARWHTDVTFVAVPPAVSVLVNDTTPVTGGDTLWADTRSAYERLHPALRDAVDHLEAVHRIAPLAYWGEPFDTALGRDDAQRLYDDALRVPPVIHPIVRVHPSTGRRNLFVNPGFTSHVVGMSRIESDGLLGLLYQHMFQPELVLRHRWRPGDVVVWDNRSTAHYATDDYGDKERRMRRVTVRGTLPVGVNGLESRVVTDPLIAVR